MIKNLNNKIKISKQIFKQSNRIINKIMYYLILELTKS